MNYRTVTPAEDSDLVEIRETLSELLDVLRLRDAKAEFAETPDSAASDTVDYVKRLLTIRTGRRRFLPPSYFDGPALTILMDLYVSDREQRQVAVSDAVAVSGVPTSTALRCIATMEKDGYVTKQPDPTDKRRTLLHATPLAIADIERLTALWRKTL
jgi:DNA-binding MarR family transcriptional regulator